MDDGEIRVSSDQRAAGNCRSFKVCLGFADAGHSQIICGLDGLKEIRCLMY
jgi:hypothetical protein